MTIGTQIRNIFSSTLVPRSLVESDETAFAVVKTNNHKELLVAAPDGQPILTSFEGRADDLGEGPRVLLCPLSTANALALRQAVPNLNPVPLGLVTSIGCGDRLGLATPGHVRAFHWAAAQTNARPLGPIFAQQSIREMTRTRRSPSDVIRDATFGALEGGWHGLLGADADHLKTTADVTACVDAGFSFYTIDPSDYVDSRADVADEMWLRSKVEMLNWAILDSSPDDMRVRYSNRVLDLGAHRLVLKIEEIWRAAAKYGNAVAHVAIMHRHLSSTGVPFELEVSVDETETPTTHTEHAFIALELRRLGVDWISLAPRYVGRFEKGVEYIGELGALQTDLVGHAAVAQALGPYKLSLHSGSDKFSVYPLIAEATCGRVHLKTAGTSYLEALRTLAQVEPGLFRAIVELAIMRYPEDRRTYHVSAELGRIPNVRLCTDAELPDLLQHFDVRELLHVTFGSVLSKYETDLKTALQKYESEYQAALEQHFIRHIAPFNRGDWPE